MKDIIYRILSDIELTPYITPTTTGGGLSDAAGAAITIAQVVLYGAAVIIVMIMGIKFITAAPDGKAQIKEKLIPAVIGAILLFAIGSIIRLVGGAAINNI